MIQKLSALIRSILQKRRMNKLKNVILNAKDSVLDTYNTYDARKYGFSLSESTMYSFPKNDYREYISTWESYQPRLGNNRYFVISDDKFCFSTVMKNYVDVAEVYALINSGKVFSVGKEDINNENLYDFFVSVKGGVIKDRGGYNGFDVYVFKCEEKQLLRNGEIVSREEFSKIIKKISSGLAQKLLVQGSFENKLFANSVNTIRMITMQKKDSFEHEVVAAIQRIGTNRTNGVDNFSQGGGTALIDIDSGVMSAMTCIDSFDKDGNRVFYSQHPDSGAQIEGVAIPNWSEVKAEIIDITRRLPLFKFIAWDIMLKDNGIAVIETNMKASLRSFQVHGGLRNKYLGQKYKEHGYIKD